jgi:hypothetical protein
VSAQRREKRTKDKRKEIKIGRGEAENQNHYMMNKKKRGWNGEVNKEEI